jgi:hypothetical protein
MKIILLFSLILSFSVVSFAQKSSSLKTKEQRQVVKTAVYNPITIADIGSLENTSIPSINNSVDMEGFQVIGYTDYDQQSNTAVDNRMTTFDDGTMAAVWTYGPSGTGPGFTGRGTGYNYFDGTSWGPAPTERIESDRCGWPCIAPYGENGEIVVSHYAGTPSGIAGLNILTRPTKGTGAWTEYHFEGPDDGTGTILAASFPRLVTTGENHDVIHLFHSFLDLTYGGMEDPLLYSRSADGGLTWDPHHAILDGLTPDDYITVGGDNVVWAQPVGETIAFAFSVQWFCDLVIMKSENAGEDWDKIVVWEHPIPLFDMEVTTFTDSLWAPDGTTSIDIDPTGKVHLLAGLCRVINEEASTSYNYWPYGEGIIYWNEDMDPFEAEDQFKALDAWDFSGALVEDVNYIGWGQDMDGDGVFTIYLEGDGLFNYPFCIGASTMPSIACGDNGEIAVAWASPSEIDIYNELYNYRRVWSRKSYDNGATWTDHYNINHDITQSFDECIYPTINKTIDGEFHLLYQADYDVGLAVRDDHLYVENRMTYYHDALIGMNDRPEAEQFISVSQNYPNPATTTTKIGVELPTLGANLSLEVSNIMGQVVYAENRGAAKNSQNVFVIDVADYTPGVYFYTVKVNEESVTHKMIVE